MKILYIASETRWSGASIALFHLIQELQLHHQIHVLLPNSTGRLYKELQNLNVKCYQTSYSLSVFPQRGNLILRSYRLLKKIIINRRAENYLKEIIENISPDIVHNNVGPLDLSLRLCKEKNIIHVWHQREYQNKDFNMTFFPSTHCFRKKIHSDGNYNIAITKGVFSHWKLRNVDRVIYDGVIDTAKHPSKGAHTQKENYFLFVGRIEPAKGLDMLLTAFSRFFENEKDFKLLIVGSFCKDEYFNHCMSIINQHKMDTSVSFLGEKDNVYSIMSKATALVVPSRFEGFGFITAEAMYNDCLVIGRNTGGTKEQFDNGISLTGANIGLSFETIDDLEKRLNEAASLDTTEIRERAFKVVSENYTTVINAQNIENFYQDILQQHISKRDK